MPLSLPAASLQIRAAFFCSVTNSAQGSVPTTSTISGMESKLTDGKIRESCRVQRDLLCQLLYY